MKLKYLSPFINPLEWFRAARFKRENSKYEKSSYDLELYLYSKILTNKMLHYGYFDNPEIKPEDISLNMLEAAQKRYAEMIMEHIHDIGKPVLDVGCGLGALAEMLHDKGMQVEVLTPNESQIEFINKNFPFLESHRCKFEEYVSSKKYGTVINSESLQYINLSEAFRKTEEIITPGGKWIIVDYFRRDDSIPGKKPHLIEDFRQMVSENKWTIKHEIDISPHILPTLRFVHMYVERLLLPLKHYGYEKFRFKKPGLFYLTGKLREWIDKKVYKESSRINPERFTNEKTYRLFVLEKISE
jgi:cyclopropane fatty-acyl-phospholipid synthase-like methyltransferase